MKKQFFVLLLLCLVCLLAASCSPREAEQLPNTSPASQTIDDEAKPSEFAPNIENNAGRSETVKIDVDLSALSSTMVYAEVYNIMMDPESYVGKTIKGSGLYNSFYYEEMDRYFHYFIISDATGCCPQGLDFVWNGEHLYPDDYPEIDENIEVTGVFIKDEIEGQPYYYIAVDDLTVLK